MTVPGSVRSRDRGTASRRRSLRALRQAEVEDLDVAIRQDEQVVGFQVPMDDALLVGRGDSPGDLERVAEGLSQGNRRRGELARRVSPSRSSVTA